MCCVGPTLINIYDSLVKRNVTESCLVLKAKMPYLGCDK